jgi:hypothetical protein
MPARAARSVLACVIGLTGCANVWGFNDLTLVDSAARNANDASSEEAAEDGSIDRTPDTTAGNDSSFLSDAGGDVSVDVAGGLDADAGSQIDAGADAEAGCGPTNTILNCGACGTTCDTTQSVGEKCIDAATCTYTGCASGWGDCDKTPPNTDGCETSLSSLSSCGGCGHACDTTSGHSLGVGCDGVSCTYSRCAPGWGDCINAPPNTDGCETNLNTTLNCAMCAQSCDTTHSTGAACNGGGCTYTGCASGWADCAAAPPDTNGCETQVSASASCGACGQTCDTTSGHSLGASCSGTTCTYTGCASGWADCNKAPPDTDGCETSLSSTSSCGACGVGCDATHSIGASCNGGACTYSGCAGGWANCVATPPDTDGCETSLSSTSNCGKCGRACNMTTGAAACDGTTCSYTCNAGRADCNASTAPDTDGCECPTPGCCGTGCQTAHSNGVGQSYYDCNTLGAYNQTQALGACTAFTRSSGQCTASTSGLCLNLSGLMAQAVCSSGAASCYCWQYNGPNPGRVQAVGGNCGAVCGSNTDPSWN